MRQGYRSGCHDGEQSSKQALAGRPARFTTRRYSRRRQRTPRDRPPNQKGADHRQRHRAGHQHRRDGWVGRIDQIELVGHGAIAIQIDHRHSVAANIAVATRAVIHQRDGDRQTNSPPLTQAAKGRDDSGRSPLAPLASSRTSKPGRRWRPQRAHESSRMPPDR